MTSPNAERKLYEVPASEPSPDGARAEMHLRIMVERMVREGRTEQAIEAAVRRAA